MKKLVKVLVWSLFFLFITGITFSGLESILSKKTDPCVNESLEKIMKDPVTRKSYYKKRILERNTLVLKMKIDSLRKTEVIVDIVLVPYLDKYIEEGKKRGVNMERLLDLDFIAYDYIYGGIINQTLGFQSKELFSKDYIVINSHGDMDEAAREIVTFHEITHHMRDDGFHCEKEDCSMIMKPSLGDSTVAAINRDRKNQLDILFDNIKDIQDER